ncbi:MAG: hypothetical protein BWY70_01415 [Bacteroidetes bacterium ADurb.Bin408]|nr:MAG: hypothetical protein BWY70_01415 [Bacteroidetes bacterium ADurb.Bin408]
MYALKFLKSERKLKFNVGSSIGIVGQLFMYMPAVFGSRKAHTQVPFQALLLPVFVPLQLLAGPYKILHFHLFEFTHAKDKLAGHNFVAKSFACLSYPKRYLHASCFLYIEVIDKNTLSRFGAQVNGAGLLAYRT